MVLEAEPGDTEVSRARVSVRFQQLTVLCKAQVNKVSFSPGERCFAMVCGSSEIITSARVPRNQVFVAAVRFAEDCRGWILARYTCCL